MRSPSSPIIKSTLLCLCMLISGIFPPAVLAEDALTLGIFPRRNATATVKDFQPLADYLAKKLDRKVQLVTSKNFQAFWQGVTRRKFDIVHFNQFHYIKSHREYGYNVILMNEEFGKRTISAAIVVRKDSGINTLQDLKGKTILFGGGRKAMISYLANIELLRQAGLNKGDYQEIFARNPPNACLGTYLKQADAGGVGDITLMLPILTRRIDTGKLKYLAVGKPLAHLPWAVHQDMKPELRDHIIRIMTGLSATSEGRKILKNAKLTGIHKAVNSDYNPHRELVRDVTGKQY